MTAFSKYAEYYDLLYADKDYEGESEFVLRQLGAVENETKSLLELGCGSGRHAVQFLNKGLAVTGIDMSAEMTAIARKRVEDSVSYEASQAFSVGDVRTVELGRTFDYVVSLFHVFSYQLTNSDLDSAFKTAAKHLSVGGKLLIDFWYGPAVIANPPEVRVRRLEGKDLSILRIAEPRMYSEENRVDVDYELFLRCGSEATVSQVRETHSMRYLFLPEIIGYLDNADLQMCESGAWMRTQNLDESSWYGWISAEHKSIAK